MRVRSVVFLFDGMLATNSIARNRGNSVPKTVLHGSIQLASLCLLSLIGSRLGVYEEYEWVMDDSAHGQDLVYLLHMLP